MRIGIDCEFSFDADNEFFLVCAAVTEEGGETHTWWYDELDKLTEYLLSHMRDTFVAHNVETAEGYMFQSLGLRPTKFRWIDTLLLSRVANNECSERHLKHGLADCLSRERITVLDKDKKHEDQNLCVWKQNCSWKAHLAKLEASKEHLLEYCLSDTAYLVKLASVLEKKTAYRCRTYLDKAKPLEPSRRPEYYGFLAACMSEISWNGIPLNGDRVKRLLTNAPTAMAHAQLRFLEKYPGSFRVKGDKITKNVAKCREFAEEVYGKDPPRTKSGAVSLASEHTKQHKGMNDFLDDYYHLDKECRALASFSKKDREKNWLGMYLPKRGVIRPRLNLLGAATGRCGSKPSSGFVYTMSKPFRGLIDPPEGYVIVELDYHSEEIGCQAYLSGDTTMAKMYEGPDYYMDISYRLEPSLRTAPKDVQKATRKKYKRIALMSNYGCGAAHLAAIAGIKEREANNILCDLKNMFSTYWDFVRDVTSDAEFSPLVFSDGFQITYNGGKITTLGNWPFQGVGALILRKILIGLYKAKVQIVAPIHDAIAFMCKESEWETVTETVAQVMRDATKECLGTTVDVGEPEVTFHGIPNCHSELASREDYAKGMEVLGKDQKEYYEEFNKYMMIGEATTKVGDSENLYVDEDFEKEKDDG